MWDMWKLMVMIVSVANNLRQSCFALEKVVLPPSSIWLHWYARVLQHGFNIQYTLVDTLLQMDPRGFPFSLLETKCKKLAILFENHSLYIYLRKPNQVKPFSNLAYQF